MMMMMAMMNPTTTDNDNITIINEGLDFILSHFQNSLWPRRISTRTTDNRQILVYSKEEAFARYRQSNFIDCRINAYPDYTEYKGINRQAPNFIFAELDRSTFKSDRALKLAYGKTVENFLYKLEASRPTIIASGSSGFHFYQPIEAFILEQEKFFLDKSANGEPSKEFLRFAEKYLTGYRSDPAHYPSFKSCMIRIPGSINSKNGKQVQIVQRWDGVTKPKINLLLYEFSRWLIYNRVKSRSKPIYQIQQQQEQQQTQNNNYNYKIYWIESLLQHPILLSDYRKRSIWRILAPYLVNTRKLSYDESFSIMVDWLNKCNQIERLDFNAKSMVKEKLASVGNYYPIGLEKLKEEIRELYDIIISSL